MQSKIQKIGKVERGNGRSEIKIVESGQMWSEAMNLKLRSSRGSVDLKPAVAIRFPLGMEHIIG